MKEHPILFSTPMVLALLDGRKTQTRREIISRNAEMTALLVNLNAGIRYKAKEELIKCYAPAINDRIWVREEHKIWFLRETGKKLPTWYCEYKDGIVVSFYTKQLTVNTVRRLTRRKTLGKWQRGRFLPKEFSRIWLTVESVNVERVLSISEEDAIAEGVESWPSSNVRGNEYRNYLKKGDEGKTFPHSELSARCSFWDLWEVIHGKENVNSNPWVWAIKFNVISTNGSKEAAISCT